MWNTKLYKVMLDTIVKEGTFRGKAIKNKEDLYRKLSTELYVSYDTVKGWTRQSSKGPRDKDVLNDLEKLLSVILFLGYTLECCVRSEIYFLIASFGIFQSLQ